MKVRFADYPRKHPIASRVPALPRRRDPPYDDGNGRVARAAMCAELTAVGQARIVIPIVFRNEYQTALRNLSREGRCDLYLRTLADAWRWTSAMPWQDRAAVDGYLVATNALVDSTDAERSGVRLELP